ncbi:M24 family metallopeptidase [Paraburkholderia sp. EG286A]|uniref:M24 family metallopeptidase n=1 Tax=Paraburkholderia sp. EG286A TaxID=3237014 RepID=UPI0034D1701A
MPRNLIFSESEYRQRVTNVQADMREKELDALIALEPESVAYLTGYLSPRGYNGFHCAVVPAEGEPVIVYRRAEIYHFEKSCAFEKSFRWSDGDNIEQLVAKAVASVLGNKKRLGVEMFSWQLNASRFKALKTVLPGDLQIEDVGNLVRRRRIIKSTAELNYMRRAGRAAEAAMDAARGVARVGASEREIGAAVAAAMVRAGSDRAEPGPIASGEAAHSIHCVFTDRVLERGDTVQLEMCPHVHNYHARFFRPLKVGEASRDEIDFARRLFEIQDEALAQVRPNASVRAADAIYRRGAEATGKVSEYHYKTFYSVGLMLYPNGAEYLEAAPVSDWYFEPGMTFHTYLFVDGFGVSETIAVTDNGYEPITRYPRELLIS